MRKFLKYVLATVVGLVVFTFLAGVMCFAMLATIAAVSSSGTETVISKNSVYEIKLDGLLTERAEEDPMAFLRQNMMGRPAQKQVGLNDLLCSVKKAKENDHIKGIYLHGGRLAGNLACMKELRDALVDFKESGKFICAYADAYGQSNYYLASVADTLLLNPYGSVTWAGLNTSVLFVKNLYAKLGVEMQVFKVGTFKSAVEPYLLDKMSEPNRLQYQVLIDDMWGEMKQAVSTSRDLTVERLDQLADQVMDMQPQDSLVAYGLVDALGYANDADSMLVRLTGTEDYKLVSTSEMKSLPDKKLKRKQRKNQVAVLYLTGTISDDGNGGIVGKKTVDDLDDLIEDDDVKAVVLRVNSGGGSAYASEQIWNAVCQLKKQKPVVVSMSDYAASGGYYISCAADSIFAQPTTLTGSIGIFGLIPNLSETTRKIGVSFDGVQTNKNSAWAEDLIYGHAAAETKAMVQAEVSRGYEQFTKRVADGRGMSQDSVKLIAEGRVWTGNKALELGLVDRLGSLQDAIRSAVVLADIEEHYSVVEYPRVKSLAEQLLEELDLPGISERILQSRLGDNYRLYQQISEATRKSGLRAEMEEVVVY